MANLISLHATTPQPRIVEQLVQSLQTGAVLLYPTDTVYAIGCDLNHKGAIQRVRQLKQLSNDKPLTFLCPSLSDISRYAYVSDPAYKLMRRLIPGPYTFLLGATKLVPKLVQNPKRKTTGIRVPDSAICQALLTALGNPIISTSAPLPPDQDHYRDTAELFDRFDRLVDVIIDAEIVPGRAVSTIIDCGVEPPKIVRRGLGWENLPMELQESDELAYL
ncbi:L-threonylcarbamoyladenylate synthase [Synechococcus sp. PCC 6312]|uniref:L-threonylcarbamoyladenylate synthase n=1 Tax=Synechococcus sp. (strain ATCC 27167 / PCC 6312) TaxID=195253 RepID=UPI00029F370E|nr:L-threonylcarbamoyladenylate synthase [Synechococcus sp. PCC 6312]AFY61056.1 translation factor SUA5 [Synechococcus sp. PCC 6312]